MSTTGIIVINDSNSAALFCIECHGDGNPENLGSDIQNILKNSSLHNGLPCTQNTILYLNGIEDLTAYLICKLKSEPGHIYLYSGKELTSLRPIADYLYIINPNIDNNLELSILEKENGTHRLLSSIIL